MSGRPRPALARRAALLLAAPLLLVAAAMACGGNDEDGNTPPAAGTPAAATATMAGGDAGQVTIASLSFGAPARVRAGARVTWTNRDNVPHTVTANDDSFKSGNLAPGATFSQEFPRAGTFAYRCSIHAEMVGSVVVE